MNQNLAVIMPAAGSSTRFGGPRSKLLETLADRPVIVHSAAAFLQRDDVKQLVVPTADLTIKQLLTALQDPRITFCAGGANRAESVLSGLKQVSPEIDGVAVHDAARPLVSQELIDRTFTAALQYSAAVPALPVHLTIKQAVGPLPAKVQRTLPRHQLWAMQTPQIMQRTHLLRAYEQCALPLEQVTDDVQLLELCGHDVWLVQGEERNLKITTRIDIELAESFLRAAAHHSSALPTPPSSER